MVVVRCPATEGGAATTRAVAKKGWPRRRHPGDRRRPGDSPEHPPSRLRSARGEVEGGRVRRWGRAARWCGRRCEAPSGCRWRALRRGRRTRPPPRWHGTPRRRWPPLFAHFMGVLRRGADAEHRINEAPERRVPALDEGPEVIEYQRRCGCRCRRDERRDHRRHREDEPAATAVPTTPRPISPTSTRCVPRVSRAHHPPSSAARLMTHDRAGRSPTASTLPERVRRAPHPLWAISYRRAASVASGVTPPPRVSIVTKGPAARQARVQHVEHPPPALPEELRGEARPVDRRGGTRSNASARSSIVAGRPHRPLLSRRSTPRRRNVPPTPRRPCASRPSGGYRRCATLATCDPHQRRTARRRAELLKLLRRDARLSRRLAQGLCSG